MIMHIQIPGIVGYLGIFRDIDAYSATLTGAQPCPFLKIKKSILILERKALIVSVFGLNLPFKRYI